MHVASVAGEKDNTCARGELLLGEGRADWLLLGAGRGNEHPFGSIKQWMHQGAFLMRGLANVRAEFSLTALAYNLRRALNILGVEAMTAAVVA
jgi:Transposase DDE domain